MTGPMDPMTMDQKIAGFSIDAHRRYRKGCAKNRGVADILSSIVSGMLRLRKNNYLRGIPVYAREPLGIERVCMLWWDCQSSWTSSTGSLEVNHEARLFRSRAKLTAGLCVSENHISAVAPQAVVNIAYVS
jgi:hypothetical protein